MNARQKIIVKKAEMLALHNKYVAAMRAGQKAIEKIAADEMAKQAMYRKVYAGIKGLKKQAYTPMYATKHRIGSLNDNISAVRRWRNGNGPAMQTAFATGVSGDNLSFNQSSVTAPTLVDRIHGAWDGIRGKGNPYGHENNGKPITAQQFDANVQGHNIPSGGVIRAAKPGEYDGSWTQVEGGGFRKGNTTSYPINGKALYEQAMAANGSAPARAPAPVQGTTPRFLGR